MHKQDLSKDAVKIFDDMSSIYEQKYMDVTRYAKCLDQFCELVRPQNQSQSVTILELACGPGNVTKYLLDQNPRFEIKATDMSSNMIALAKKNNPNIEVFDFDMRELDSAPQFYNGIVSGFGLPYLNKDEAIKFIQSAYSKLLEGGVLYLSVTEGKYEDSTFAFSPSTPTKKLFVHLYESQFIISQLMSEGFSIEVCEKVIYNIQDGKTVSEFIVIALK